ncbi:MAG: tetratricopeptide repeat protein, partial [Flavobacteriales bacterium]
LNLEPIDIEDYLEDDLDLSEPEKKTIREESNSIYHIERFKVVDYREIREDGVTVEQLSYDGGLAANQENHNSTNEPLIQRTQEQIAYVDYLAEAMILFAKEKFKKANKMYELILEHYSDDANALFYSGMCNYHLGNYDKSEALFLAPVGDQINTFEQETEYYLALTYRRSKQKERACELFSLIIKRADFYAEDAAVEQERFCQ